MKSKLKYNSVSHRVAKLINILANWCVTIPSSFETHHSKNAFCHSILDSYIIGNCNLIDELIARLELIHSNFPESSVKPDKLSSKVQGSGH